MLILAAIVPWPYWFHGVLRFVVSGSAVYTAYWAHERRLEPWAWTMVAMVILYNPLAPLNLGPLQGLLDLAAAGLFAAALWRLRR
jgi:hypothetical protein